MDSGFSLTEVMDILQSKKNHIVFSKIQERLERGEESEKFLHEYIPGEYRLYLTNFMKFLPFLESLQLTIEIVLKEKQQKEKLRKQLIYPCGLFIGMCIGIFVFDRTVLPNMLSLLDMFRVSDNMTVLFSQMIEVVSMSVFLISLCCSILIYFGTRDANICRSYQLISRFFPESILIQYGSLEFARFFLECTRKKIPTRQCLAIMKEMYHRPLVSMLAQSLDQLFQQGTTLTEAIGKIQIENSLVKFMRLAIYSSETEKILIGYLEMSSQRTEKQIENFTKTIQMMTYLSIGVVVIFVYHILLMPMSMLQQLA